MLKKAVHFFDKIAKGDGNRPASIDTGAAKR